MQAGLREGYDLETRQNMSKQPFFTEKRADYEYFEDCGSMQCAAIRSIFILYDTRYRVEKSRPTQACLQEA